MKGMFQPQERLPPSCLLLQVTVPPTSGSGGHAYWLAGVDEGLLEVFPGCFRSWLSSSRSLFSSHMSTEALWEAFCGGSGAEDRQTGLRLVKEVPHRHTPI